VYGGTRDTELATTRKGGGTCMKNGGKRGGFGYVGRIKNSGPQVVQAPIQTTVSKKGTVKTGNDLRSGKK
jgi:hypothetical protein